MSDDEKLRLQWNDHQSTLVRVIDNFLTSELLVDCTLAAEGQYLHAHKVILCACSPYFETLLNQHYEKHPIIILKDIKFQQLKFIMDYMYKGEVNTSLDQMGEFLKVVASLQIKGLTDSVSGDDNTNLDKLGDFLKATASLQTKKDGGDGDNRVVGSADMSRKRHEPTSNQSRSPTVSPPHTSGLKIEPSEKTLPTHLSESHPRSLIRSREGSKSPSEKTLPTHLSESQPKSLIRSREGSKSPTQRKRQRRLSEGKTEGYIDNSCNFSMQSQSVSIKSVPSSIPALPSDSPITITKAPSPDEDPEKPESDGISGLSEGVSKEKIESRKNIPVLLELLTEYLDETNNDDKVEDSMLEFLANGEVDDDMIRSGARPSHVPNNPSENCPSSQQMASDRQDGEHQERFVCNICNRNFSRLNNLKIHMARRDHKEVMHG